MLVFDKRAFRVLLMAVAISLLSLVCSSSKVERIIRVVDTDQNQPAANKTFVFFEDAPLAPMVKAAEPVIARLDMNGEAHISLRMVAGWGRLDKSTSSSYGTSLKASDIADGGRFRLYSPPPVPTDTNIYSSQYVLEIRKP